MHTITPAEARIIVAMIDAFEGDLASIEAHEDYPGEAGDLMALRNKLKPADPQEFSFSVTNIGTVPMPDNGCDQYVLLSFEPDADPPNEAQVASLWHSRACFSSDTPGRAFCNSVNVMPVPYSDGYKWVCISYVRHDV